MDIGFSERLGNIVALSDALIKAGKESTESREEARVLEDEIYRNASSKDDYQDVCSRMIETLHPSSIESESVTLSLQEDEILNADGPTFGDYSFATFHRDGQMSTVYKAKAKIISSARDKIVALKITHPSLMTAPHNSEREARLLAVCRHDNVLPLIECFPESGSQLVLVFPFLRQDLENLLRTASLTKLQSGMVFTGLFNALAYIHSLGVIHRDVKPSNILLKSMDGPVYLTDFGIAWSPDDKDSEPANQKITDVGTTSYRPPELLFGHRAYDQSLDMWAAGCVIGEIVKKDHYPIFDAGPLGSELGLIKSMFTTLGTPNDENWPSAQSFPDWSKVHFQVFPSKTWQEILPGASQKAIDFVSKTVRFESTERLTAIQALQHPLATES